VADLKVEILLPLYYDKDHKGRREKIEGKKYSETYDDLMDEFGGCTIDNSSLLGGWVDPNTKERINDENTTYWVVCQNTKKNIKFFHRFKNKLKKRFQQKDMMMYYIIINKI
jgi:hypothetical protein